MKKTFFITLGILLALIAAYIISSGFFKDDSVFINEYSVSEDGKEITVNIGVGSSIGFIRKLAVRRQEEGTLYVDAYSAFGGINGNIGAKSVYTLPLEEDTTTIAICRNAGTYEDVLKKDENGIWQRVK